MEWYEPEVQALEEAYAAYSPPPGQVVFYGSSSIRLWSSLADDFEETGVLNLGFGGSTLAACTHFFERIVVPHQPRSIIFYAGDNDLGDGQPVEKVVQSLQDLLQKIDHYLDAVVFAFISIKPSPARWPIIERIKQTNQIIQNEMIQRASSYYIDVYQPMLDSKGLPRPELFEPDGLHLNSAGYRLWAQILSSYRSQIF